MNAKHAIALAVCLAGLPGLSSAETTAQLMETWLNLESQKGQLVTDWREREQYLQQKLSLLEAEQQTLQKTLREADQDTSEVDQKRRELINEQNRLERRQSELSDLIDRKARYLSGLIDRLPPPLQQNWRHKALKLTEDNDSLSKRLEALLSLCQSLEQFDERLAIHKTAMTLPGRDGSSHKVRVTQLFLGLSQGWYVSDQGEYYGYGQPEDRQWRWQHLAGETADQSAVQVRPEQLLNILQMVENPTRAKFIALEVAL